MTRHSHLNKRKVIDLIAVEAAAGRQVTDQQIMDLCDFWAREQVKSLLADLADSGEISIAWNGPHRTITLGASGATKRPDPARPIPSVVRPDVKAKLQAMQAADDDDDEVDEAASRIFAILQGDTAQQPTRDAVTVVAMEKGYQGASGTAREASSAVSSGTAERIEDRAPSPEPAVNTPPPAPLATPPSPRRAAPRPLPNPDRAPSPDKRRQINIHADPGLYEMLAEAAAREGVPTTSLARRILLDAMDAARCDTQRRHRLRASIVRAADHAGIGLDQFVTMLIELGFSAYQAERAPEIAEAAE